MCNTLTVIMGDFNIDVSNDIYDSIRLRNFFNMASLYNIPFTHTHHTSASHTTIDYCIVDDADKVLEYGQDPVSFLSAHDLIFVTIQTRVPAFLPHSSFRRNLWAINRNLVLGELETVDWAPLVNADTIDLKLALLQSKVLDIIDIHAPLRLVRYRKAPPPWFTSKIKAKIHERNLLRRRWLRHRSPEFFLHLKSEKFGHGAYTN